MKNKSGLIVVIVVLSVLVGFLGGYIISDNLIDKEPNNEVTNNGNDNNNNENVETEKDYSLTKAEELMSKYLYSTSCNREYIDDLNNEEIKNVLAIKNSKKSDEYNCNLVYGNDFGEKLYYYNGAYACIEDDAMGKIDFYKYNDVLASKKLLFGSDESLTKKTFDSTSSTVRYEYNSNYNIYVGLQLMGGGACPPSIKNTVESAKISNDTLKIVVVKKEYNLDDNTQEMTTVKSENQIQYIFKQANNNYYLAEVNKIK